MICNPCCAILASIAYLQTIFEAQKDIVNNVTNDLKKVALTKELERQNNKNIRNLQNIQNINNIVKKDLKIHDAYTLPTEKLNQRTNIEGFFSNNNITEEPVLKATQNVLKNKNSYYPTDGQYACVKHKVENPCASNGTLTSSNYGFAPF